MRNITLAIRSFIILLALLFCTQSKLVAQKQSDRVISLDFKNKTLVKVLYDLSEEYNLKFYFDIEDLPLFLLSGTFEEKQLYSVLHELVNGTKLIILPYNDSGVLVLDKKKVSKEYINQLVEKWDNGLLKYPTKDEPKNLSYTFGDPTTAGSSNVNVNIHIFDEISKDPLVGGALSNDDFTLTSLSDENGTLALEIPVGKHIFNIDYIGYQRIILNLEVYEDANINIPVPLKSFQMDEIEIVANTSRQKLENVKAGMEKLSMQELNLLPQITGDVDLLKSIEIIPGVTSTNELSQGFNIRGGSTDQNLILLDDGIIFNPTHIVGFVSAFNPDIIREANLYKGYVDASFGGRVSGVLDVKTNDEGEDKFSGKGGVGLSMLKLYISSTVSDKVQIKLAGRGSFNDYLLKNIANVEIRNSNANFYDLNANIRFNLSKSHSLFFKNYLSNDLFEYNDEFGYQWSNYHSGLQLKSDWNNGFYSKLSLNLGHYKSENFTLNRPDAFRFLTGIEYRKVLATLDKRINEEGYARLGVEYLSISNEEDKLKPEGNSTITENTLLRKGLSNIAPFLSYSSGLFKNLKLETGIRFSYLNLENSEESYFNIEPRVSLSYNLKERTTLKVSYNRMSQFINQFSNTNGALPSDIWVLSNQVIQPSVLDQYSVGAIHLNEVESYEFGMDLFYKDFKNLYELDDFAQIILNENLNNQLLDAVGESYGAEFLIKKLEGQWQGSLAYTFSRSLRRVVDENKTINNGEYFSANYDIPHQINILLVYQWLPVVSFNMAYVFRSGAPTTAPNASFIQDGYLVPLYSKRNEERIDYYSRLDMSINLDLRKSSKKGIRSSFHLGFYNLLSRRNPTNVFFRRSNLGNIVPFQFAVVGTVIPNLSWNFIF